MALTQTPYEYWQSIGATAKGTGAYLNGFNTNAANNYSKYAASYNAETERMKARAALNSAANQSSSRGYSVSGSNSRTYRTPEQTAFMNSLMGTLKGQIADAAPKSFSDYLADIQQTPFQRVDIPDPGKFWNTENDLMMSALMDAGAGRQMGGMWKTLEQDAARRGVGEEALLANKAANQRSVFAQQMAAMNEFERARIASMEGQQLEAARARMEQEDMARAYEMAQLQAAREMFSAAAQREGMLYSAVDPFLSPLSQSNSYSFSGQGSGPGYNATYYSYA